MLNSHFKPPLSLAETRKSHLEGWILGVCHTLSEDLCSEVDRKGDFTSSNRQALLVDGVFPA